MKWKKIYPQNNTKCTKKKTFSCLKCTIIVCFLPTNQNKNLQQKQLREEGESNLMNTITKCECNSLILVEWTKCIDEFTVSTRFYSLGQVNSLKVQWNHSTYGYTFCCNARKPKIKGEKKKQKKTWCEEWTWKNKCK